MIQRIQSIFLLIACILLGVVPFVAAFKEVGQTISLNVYQELYGLDVMTWRELPNVANIISILFSLTAIFSFKKRPLQIKLIYVSMLFSLAYYPLIWCCRKALELAVDGHVSWDIGIIFPAIAIIFMFIAIGKIKKDEKLVKSLDRIR